MITTVPLANLRVQPAVDDDVSAIHALLQIYADMGNLLPRSAAEIRSCLKDFCVVKDAGEVVACGALEIFTADLGEVRSLVVAERCAGRGLGRAVVEYLIQTARDRGLTRLMALTYRPQFFERLGFTVVAKASLPEKVWGVCIKCYKLNRCDEIAVLRRI
ncbi:MAG: N-acetyltransferase [Gammaproteobacteria bacterium]|nr:N-acetyltransferase [Gammaproteobacteria bacterium]